MLCLVHVVLVAHHLEDDHLLCVPQGTASLQTHRDHLPLALVEVNAAHLRVAVSVEHPDEAHRGGVKNANLAMDTAESDQIELCRVVDAVNSLDLSLLLRVVLESLERVDPQQGLLAFNFLPFSPFFVRLDLLRTLLLLFLDGLPSS